MSRPAVRAWYAAVVVGGLGACTLAGCKASDDRGLAIFEVTVAATVPDFQTLRFTSPDHPTVPARDLDGPSHRQPFRLGYYLPDPSGGVTVVGTAIRADGCAVGEGTASALGVTAGKQVDGGPLMIVAFTTARCAGADAGDGGSGDAEVPPPDGHDGPADTHLAADGPTDTRVDVTDADGSVAPDTAPSLDAPGGDASMQPDMPAISDGSSTDTVLGVDAPVDGPKDGTITMDAADAGAAGLSNGATCVQDPDCISHHCVDGRCCGVAACATCEACIGAGGTCSQVTKHEDPDTCSGAQACDATGHCVNRISEFALPPLSGTPIDITPGPDGYMWFTTVNANDVGKIALDGSGIAEYPLSTPSALPSGIITGPDQNIWFAESGAARIGRANSGFTSVTEIVLASGTTPGKLAVGPDGNIWFSATSGSIGRVAPDGTGLTQIAVPGKPTSITTGPDGNLWVVESMAGKIARIAPNGTGLTEIMVPASGSQPNSITKGLDGNLWFVDAGANLVGRVSPSSLQITTFNIPTAGSSPARITSAPDGNLWFTELASSKIGRLVPSTGSIFEVSTPAQPSYPEGIAVSPDGYLWFTEEFPNNVGRLIP
jgi:streptogramin lyase